MSNYFTFSTFYLPMIYGVLPSFRKKIQIFQFIIERIFVNVLNYFTFCKIATKSFFSNQSVFGNISLFVSKWMVWRFYFNISLRSFSLAAIPFIMFIKGKIPKQSLIPRNLYALLSFIPRYSFFHILNYSILKTYTASGGGGGG